MRASDLKPCDDQGIITWPLSRAQQDVLRDVIRNLFRPAASRGAVRGNVLWSEVMRLIGYGSTSATQLCLHLKLDPDQLVVRRRL